MIRDTTRFRGSRGHIGQPVTASTLVAVHDGFFITEPQVNAIWYITGWMRLDAGVGYRFIGGPTSSATNSEDRAEALRFSSEAASSAVEKVDLFGRDVDVVEIGSPYST